MAAPAPPSAGKRPKSSTFDDLPWRPSRWDHATARWDEVGFVGLEEIPAGSYQLASGPTGPVIQLKPGMIDTQPTDAVVGRKRKRPGRQDGTSALVEAAGEGEDDSDAASGSEEDVTLPVEYESGSDEEQGEEGEVGGEDEDGVATTGGGGKPAARRTAIPTSDLSPAWAPLSLHPIIMDALARCGFRSPTPIQLQALPAAVLHYKDVIGAAATGSGKTLSYGLPIIHRLLQRRQDWGMPVTVGDDGQGRWRHLPALVLTPTRELAVQVRDHFLEIAQPGTCLKVVAVVGGLAVEKQRRLLRARPDIVIATPGRLWDVIRKGEGYLSALHKLQFLVLDEADRLCEKGHFAALNDILKCMQPPPAAGGDEPTTAPASTAFMDPVAERILARLEAKTKAAAQAAVGEGDEAAVDEAGTDAAGSGDKLVDVPGHVRRQTFLFSATLGIATSQSIKEAAAALVAAKMGVAGEAQPTGKKQRRMMKEAIAAASRMSPVECLMARVGVLGKPAVVTVERTNPADAEEEGEGEGEGEGEATSDGGAGGSDEEEGTVAVTPTAGGSVVAKSVKSGKTGRSATSTAAGVFAGVATAVALPPGLRLCRITCLKEDKDEMLYYFLLRYPGRTLIFVNAITTLRKLSLLLQSLRLPVETLHAHMQQRQRLKHLERFAADPHAILVATDVAARGLDIPSVQYVLHYSLPPSAEGFVHRCGRTARGDKAGLAAALVGPDDQGAYTRTMTVLGLPSGLPEFPIDPRYSRAIIARLSLARKIAIDTAALNRASSEAHWLSRQVKGTGLALDEDDDDEVIRGAAMALKRHGGVADDDGEKEEVKEEAESEEGKAAAGEGDDGDHKAKRRRADDAADAAADMAMAERSTKARIAKCRRELDDLLRHPLLPTGTSKRYLTTSTSLGEEAHPLRDAIRLEPLAPSATSLHAGGVVMGALKAPSVVLPTMGVGPIKPSKGARGMGGRRGAIMASAAHGTTAIESLAMKGKHVHVPSLLAATGQGASSGGGGRGGHRGRGGGRRR